MVESAPMSGSEEKTGLWAQRRLLAVCLVLLALLSLYVFSNYHFTNLFLKEMEADRRAGLERMVRLARNAVEPTVREVREGRLTRQEGIERVRTLVRGMLYEDQYGKNYIFMSAYDGTMLLQPYEPVKEGSNQWDLRDEAGKYIIRSLVATARSSPGGGFVSYRYPPPNSQVAQEKMAFVIGIPELGCYLGTGMYLEAFNAQQKAIIRNIQHASFLFFLLVILVALGFYREIQARNRLLTAEVLNRRQNETALRESEGKYRELFEAESDALFLIDNQTGRILQANEAAAALYGYTVGELLAMTNRDLSAEPEQTRAVTEKTATVKEAVVKIPLRHHRKKTGETFPVEITGRFFTFQGRPVHIAAIRDISERLHTEEALIRSELSYRELVENVHSVIVRLDGAGTIRFINDYGLNLFGYREEELVGRNVVGTIVPERESTGRDLKAMMAAIIRTPDRFIQNENENLCKDGRRLWLSWRNKTVRDREGQLLEILAVGQDITERMALRERLQRAEKMEAMGNLAGGVAHDLNNILGVLMGFSELLLLDAGPNPRLKGHVEKILQSANRGTAIVQDLLTLARRGVAVSETVNLNRIVSEYLQTPEFLSLQAHHPGVTILTSLAPDLLNLKGSAVHLMKTVMNLLSNASESITGVGEVTLRTENRYVDRPITGYDDVQVGDYVVLTVRDSGQGISPEDLGKIFEPFYTKKRMGRSGTGLGLAVVWGTVKDHGGYIDVQSQEGQGTVFTLYFPATREELTAAAERAELERYRGRGERVLVVDDVEEQRALGRGILGLLGYAVHTAASGEEAVEWLRANRADLVVLDMIMDPGMDGLETYRKIIAIRPGQKAIVVSGFAETERVRAVERLGAGAYVRKPFTIEALGLAVRAELDRQPG